MATRLRLIGILVACLQICSGQVTVNFTAPAEDIPGQAVTFTCEYTLTAPATLQLITIQREEGSPAAYTDILTYNETAQASDSITRYSGSASSGFFEFVIDSTLEADAGNYKCIVTDSVDATAEDIAALAVTNENACDRTPCKNGGTCTDGVDTFTCVCLACYNNSICTTQAVNECDAAPCKNGGTCTDGCDTYTCGCKIGFGGTTCTTVCDGVQNITSPVTVPLGSQVTLTCTTKVLTATDTVYWSMDAEGAVVESRNADFTFRATAAHAGTHYCFVNENSDCLSRMSTEVTVTYELNPNTTTTENVTIKELEDKTLTCTATGMPIPMLQWTFVPLVEERPDIDPMDGNRTDIIATTPEPATTPRPMPTTRPPPQMLGNATANETVHMIRRARQRDAGHYVCVADQGSGAVRTVIQDIHIRVEPLAKKSGLETWEIALIVIGCVLFLGIIVGVIFIVLWKTGKAGAICPTDKVGAAENGKSSSTPYEKSSPRPLPEAPGARGGALPPLDLQAEKAKVKKKKKKPKKVASDHEQEDSGNENF